MGRTRFLFRKKCSDHSHAQRSFLLSLSSRRVTQTLRSFCGDLSGLIRAVEFRDIDAGLTCIAAFGSDAWDRLFGKPRPAELHPFREFRSGNRYAPATPGDVLFHIRAATNGHLF